MHQSKISGYLQGAAIAILVLHFYLYGYGAFKAWGLSTPVTDRIFASIARWNMFYGFHRARVVALGLLIISSLPRRYKVPKTYHVIYLLTGLILYFGIPQIFYTSLSPTTIAVIYALGTTIGTILCTQALIQLKSTINDDVFNKDNESFPQEEQLKATPDSLNFATSYSLKGRTRKGWLNIDPYRGLLLMGSPGSGKTRLVQSIIRQHMAKGFSMVIYDFKNDDLTKYAYYCWQQNPAGRAFYVINFEDLTRTHRCNPLHPQSLKDIADAADAARTILLALNRDWIERQGDFWIESSISLMTAIIWYLKKVKEAKYCTLPHAIELLQTDYADLFSILRSEPEIANYVNPLVNAYLNNVKETLDNQVSSLKIAVNRLGSPAIYYVLSGHDCSLDINDPKAPKIVCLANSPLRSGIYGPVISLYVTTINRLVNQKDKAKSSHIYDEMPTIYIHQLHELLATGRSNRIALTLCSQNIDQLKLNYGDTQKSIIANLPGSIISGQNSGESARLLSERIGKVMQRRQSIHLGDREPSVTESSHLDPAVPVSRIAALSVGEFVGLIADNHENPNTYKVFHARIDLPEDGPQKMGWLPLVNDKLTPELVTANYLQIKADIAGLVDDRLGWMRKTPALAHLIINR